MLISDFSSLHTHYFVYPPSQCFSRLLGYWMPDQVRHDSQKLSTFSNYDTVYDGRGLIRLRRIQQLVSPPSSKIRLWRNGRGLKGGCSDKLLNLLKMDHPHPNRSAELTAEALPRQWGGLLATLKRLLDGLFRVPATGETLSLFLWRIQRRTEK